MTSESKAPVKILHIDDEESFLEMSRSYLQSFFGGMTIETEISPTRALEKIKKNDYDVIISDYQMPVLSGLDILKEVRNAGCKTPFIIFTGKSREEVAIQALNLGADFYIQKSQDLETVFEELHHFIKKLAEYYRKEKELQEESFMNRKLINTFPNMLALIDSETQVIVSANKASKDIGATEGTLCHEKWFGEESRCPWCLAPLLLEKKQDLSRIVATKNKIYICHWIYVSTKLYLHYIEDITEKSKLEIEKFDLEERT